MTVSKNKFVRDMMRMQMERDCDRKEREAEQVVTGERDEYSGYCNNKSYRGKKRTLWQYQS